MHGRTCPGGLSLHIGLNQVDPTHYTGRDGMLVGCENDARELQAVAVGEGFRTKILLTRAATSAAVLATIQNAANKLEEGDFFLLTYSGGGGQINDATTDEPDGMDETWVLYDRQVLDGEFYQMYCDFRPGVRVFVLADSCHSGVTTKTMFFDPAPLLPALEARVRATRGPELRAKFLLPEVQLRLYKERCVLYDDLRRKTPHRDKANVEGSVLLMAACQRNDGQNKERTLHRSPAEGLGPGQVPRRVSPVPQPDCVPIAAYSKPKVFDHRSPQPRIRAAETLYHCGRAGSGSGLSAGTRTGRELVTERLS